MSKRWLRFAMVPVLALACTTEATVPESHHVDGVFVLRTMDGDSLPIVMGTLEGPPPITVHLVADTIVLRADGTGEEIEVHEFESTTPPQEPGETERRTFRYTVDSDGKIAVTLDCPEFIQCAAGPHYRGTLSEGELVMDFALGAAVPQVFQRIGSTQ